MMPPPALCGAHATRIGKSITNPLRNVGLMKKSCPAARFAMNLPSRSAVLVTASRASTLGADEEEAPALLADDRVGDQRRAQHDSFCWRVNRNDAMIHPSRKATTF